MATIELLFPAFVGGVGWLITNTVVGPWVEFLKLRQQALETLTFYAGISSNVRFGKKLSEAMKSALDEAQTTYRKLASRLGSLYDTLPWYLRWYAKARRYNIELAVASLFVLSNTYGDEAIIAEEQVREFLRLKRHLSDETVKRIQNALYSDIA